MGAVRSKRFAMVVEDMKVTYIGVETKYDCAKNLDSFRYPYPKGDMHGVDFPFPFLFLLYRFGVSVSGAPAVLAKL